MQEIHSRFRTVTGLIGRMANSKKIPHLVDENESDGNFK